jgi:hypothetical protein
MPVTADRNLVWHVISKFVNIETVQIEMFKAFLYVQTTLQRSVCPTERFDQRLQLKQRFAYF